MQHYCVVPSIVSIVRLPFTYAIHKQLEDDNEREATLQGVAVPRNRHKNTFLWKTSKHSSGTKNTDLNKWENIHVLRLIQHHKDINSP